MPGRYHSREFKIQLCKQVSSGERRPAQICREHNIANSLLVKWRHEYEARGEAAFTPRQPSELPENEALHARISELERFCGQLALENSVLKKASLLALASNTANRSRSDTL